jgi:3-oxoacyl-[acyl-carrier protein] reductase
MDSRKVALITGASRGIGRGLVEHFLSDGYRVAGCSRGAAPAIDGDYEHSCIDIADEKAVQGWVKGVARSHRRIDVIVNNAGEYAQTPAMLTAGGTLEKLMRINYMGSFFASREAAKVMVRQKSGRIINMASMACGLHSEGASAYAATKSAVIEYSKVLAKELAKSNVTVNVVAPSMVETDMLEELGEKSRESALQSLTLKRSCSLDEVNHVVAFLASDLAACVTGQVIYLGLVV